MPLEATTPGSTSTAASTVATDYADASKDAGTAGTAPIWAHNGGWDDIWGYQSEEHAAEAAAAVDGLVLELEPGGEGNMHQQVISRHYERFDTCL
jgi:hypothetical protein